MSANSLSDDYVAKLLQDDAKRAATNFASQGLGAYLPKRATTQAPRPNTRFLRNIIRETDSHNKALLAKEAEEARSRLRAFKRERDDHVEDGRAARRRRHHYEQDGSNLKRRKRENSFDRDSNRQTSPEGSRKRSERANYTSLSASRRRPRSDSRERGHDLQSFGSSDSEDGESRRHKRDGLRQSRRHDEAREGRHGHQDHGIQSRVGRGRHSHSYTYRYRSRSCASSEDTDRRRRRRGDRDHKRDNSRTHKRRPSRSPERGRHIRHSTGRGCSSDSDYRHDRWDERRRSRESRKYSDRPNRHASSDSRRDLRHVKVSPLMSPPPSDRPIQQLDGADSDPLEDIVGPLPPPPPPKIKVRGRGAISSAAMDSHFSSNYDPSADVSLDLDEQDDWDQALEALQARAKFKQSQGDRLRAAGFTEDEIKTWEKGGERSEEDVTWAKSGEGREWDRGKVLDDDGALRVNMDYGRLR